MEGARISSLFCVLLTKGCDTVHSLLRHVVPSTEQTPWGRRAQWVRVFISPPLLSCRPGSTCWSLRAACSLIFSLPWFSEPCASHAIRRPTPTGLCRSTCWTPCSTWFVSSQPASPFCPGTGFCPRERGSEVRGLEGFGDC